MVLRLIATVAAVLRQYPMCERVSNHVDSSADRCVARAMRMNSQNLDVVLSRMSMISEDRKQQKYDLSKREGGENTISLNVIS